MAKKKRELPLNVGTSSVLFIFVILCLVSFAILSLSSAMSDYKLSKRVVENSQAYYDACNEAEVQLASFDKTLKDLYDTGISRAGYFENVGKKKTFAIPINDIQTLEVEIRILYPESAGESFYDITSWKTDTTGELDYDDTLPVFGK
ncbi:hypothetical protein SAMN02910339_01964 [Lachnospiraceae bacterium YSD2013]|nr:hypothetical protein SAMN02910339_01964 [Lachnospiraceae bacterium YSD2013]